MEKVSQNDIAWLSQSKENFDMFSIHHDNLSSKPNPSKTTTLKHIYYYLLGLLFLLMSLVVAPFFILIRTAVELNISHQWDEWLSLLGGVTASTLFLSLFFIFLFRKAKRKLSMVKVTLICISILVGGFCTYGLLYLNSVHAKNESIKEVYSTLHPILRVAIASTTLADQNLVITDIKRTPDDYVAMGLTPHQSSLHYMQSTGYVHAIDLRTLGRSELRNTLLEWSLQIMGFQTIRHVGTADHLHVALPK